MQNEERTCKAKQVSGGGACTQQRRDFIRASFLVWRHELRTSLSIWDGRLSKLAVAPPGAPSPRPSHRMSRMSLCLTPLWILPSAATQYWPPVANAMAPCVLLPSGSVNSTMFCVVSSLAGSGGPATSALPPSSGLRSLTLRISKLRS
jgi:hypothetical protein